MADSAKGDGRLVFDCLSAVLLLAVAILGAYMPKYLASRGSLQQGTASSLAFHLGNMLSGGVMLSAGFCHLLADALRQLAFLGRFPIAPFLAACGYLITLLADQVVQLLTTDAEDPQHSRMPSPNPGMGLGFSRQRPGFSRPMSAQPLSSQTPPPTGSAFSNFLRNGLGQKAWGYSRLEDEAGSLQHQQQHQQGSGSGCNGGAIELITAPDGYGSQNGGYAGSIAAAAAAVVGNGHPVSSGQFGQPGYQQFSTSSTSNDQAESSSTPACQHHPQQRCHNPASCTCCSSHAAAAAAGGGDHCSSINAGSACDAAAALSSSSTGVGAAAVAAATNLSPLGSHTRRPGSAGGLARAGLGLGSVARTRSLTSPSAVSAAALPPLVAAAAAEFGVNGAGEFAPFEAAATAGAGGIGGSSAASATATDGQAAAGMTAGQSFGSQQPQQVVLAPVLTSAAAAVGGSTGDDNDALCVLAAGSPRSVSANGLHPRSPRVKAAAAAASAGLIHQQQHQQTMPHTHQQSGIQVEQQVPLPLQQQLQQLQLTSPVPQQQQQLEPQRTSSSIAQRLMQPVRQLSLPVGGTSCCCCVGGGGCRSALPSAQPDMTEACTVARVAGHLELEVMSTATGGHNHAHFQVFLSQRPLSFATSLLLACALCIHSILEGLALGAQQSMQATEDIMLAIAAHKGLAAYALGASIVESGASDQKFWVVVCLFAAATPLGIAIGYASSVLGHGPVSAAMSALASGTFLYVALNEVIPKELEHPDGHRLAKVAALLLGFGLMSLLAVWA